MDQWNPNVKEGWYLFNDTLIVSDFMAWVFSTKGARPLLIVVAPVVSASASPPWNSSITVPVWARYSQTGPAAKEMFSRMDEIKKDPWGILWSGAYTLDGGKLWKPPFSSGPATDAVNNAVKQYKLTRTADLIFIDEEDLHEEQAESSRYIIAFCLLFGIFLLVAMGQLLCVLMAFPHKMKGKKGGNEQNNAEFLLEDIAGVRKLG